MDTANLIGSLVGLAVSILVAWFLYNDANARGRNGVLWGIFGFFFSLITLIVWLIVRNRK